MSTVLKGSLFSVKFRDDLDAGGLRTKQETAINL